MNGITLFVLSRQPFNQAQSIIFSFVHLLNLILIFLIVAFLTLIERKILGSHQLRKGPDKVRVKGVIQPIADAIKLISKSNIELMYYNTWFYILNPLFIFVNICII